ncbi:MAG: hypothetical protein GFH27_549303n102 [Chloroflexi bacterium AL-W]|nr:hypothetical protein [Chloroflexi bacterium AL-N1]NOK67987.1 hypothetical protein [Chloroflexi bacterium AL-N10]NOK73327.1 hypothetical protein [Chloroflexi bacterium AL-N5]NOK83241.1 hypothetical protein [Chloroflexi bacterium AL-W]NOK87658.1 hypothetical protein [Chloroflexi bacterium AL-N15]
MQHLHRRRVVHIHYLVLFVLLASLFLANAPLEATDTTVQLSIDQSSGPAGVEVTLSGSGYAPGNQAGTIRWDDQDAETFLIPEGGSFSVPFIIPENATPGSHTITVCSFYPCTTGESEQTATVAFDVFAHQTFLPLIIGGQGSAPPPFSYQIDPAVAPTEVQLPELGGQARPLSAVADPDGDMATFVANELVVQTDDTNLLDQIVRDYNGTIIFETNPDDAGLTDLATLYLVRVDLSTADLSRLTADLQTIDGGEEGKAAGEHRFSDEEGARLMAIASAEALKGATVGINWVSETGTVPDNSREADDGVNWGGIAYTRNAYDWTYMAAGTIQDIGTAEAWNALHHGGKYNNRVRIAILDGGFAANDDFPSEVTYLNVFPFDPRNRRDVEGGWHGTNVFQTAMANGSNNYGVVGVAHTVGEPVLVYTSYDYVISIGSVIAARAAGARVINMSYSAEVPAVFSWTVLPFEITTAAVRASGTLLFASAGNDDKNVDDRHCFIVCWEKKLHTPCENRGVICVGGLDWNSQRRASYDGSGSNFGSRGGVHIFAPYLVYGGHDPDNPASANNVRIIAGTSFSAPYTAGVAGLIWAANPSLSANQVWEIMRDTAHSSPDTSVPRYVNAYDAVMRATDFAISATITNPGAGSTQQKNYNVNLQADIGYVANGDRPPVTVRWSSNLDGALGEETFNPGTGVHGLTSEINTTSLRTGTHTIRVRATAGSLISEDTIQLTIVNTPPTASITQPETGTSFCFGETVTLRGLGSDINELDGLPDSALRWSSSRDGNLGNGRSRSLDDLSVGAHTITLHVTDDGGLAVEDSIALTVLSSTNPACTNLNPSAVIISPENGSIFYADAQDSVGWYYELTLTGQVGDAEDTIGDLTVEWESDVEGVLTPVTVNPSTGATNVTARLYASGCGTTHTITLRVEDSDGNVKEDTITVIIGLLC